MYLERGVTPEHLEYFDRRSSHAVGNFVLAAYYTFSAATFGLPQTTKHLCSKVRDFLAHDTARDRYNATLDEIEIVATATAMAAQIKLIQAVYFKPV